MIPNGFEFDVGEDTSDSHSDESKEHLAHGEHSWLVYHIFISAFVDKLEHLVGLDLSVA